MTVYWAIETRGDPMGALEKFLTHLWVEAHLEGMILSADVLNEEQAGARLIGRLEEVHVANPFRPWMRTNIARDIPAILCKHPGAMLGAMLRPCELRALDEMVRIAPFPRDRLLTICVDCLGTYPAREIEWRTKRRGSLDGLSHDVLQLARLGGIGLYRFRTACQVCRSPRADQAVINIGVIGLPARQALLVETSTEEVARRFHFDAFPLDKAESELVHKRDQVLRRVSARNSLTSERTVHGLTAGPKDLEGMVKQLNRCGDCRACQDACPICSVQPLERGISGFYDRVGVARWLSACAGCGMCEQACVKNLPLSAIFRRIGDQLPI